ncbi:MAG: molybdate ABC transporter substrate-binding protein [Angustibacter sp.]
MRRRLAALAVVLAVPLAVPLAACGSDQQPSSSTGPVTGTVTVLAAASLTEAFTGLAKQFEAAHPGSKVVLSFGPSSGLAQQVLQGAPADVFASASAKNMQQVVDAGDVATPRTFARNVLEIAVPPANPGRVTGVADLAKQGVKVALCQPQVPCGAVAATVFANAGISVTPVTQEADVKAVLSKVSLGEVDAGLVYTTDVRAAGTSVRGITIPARLNASTTYPIAALDAAPNPAAARAFVDLVLSDSGRAALAAAGFEAP